MVNKNNILIFCLVLAMGAAAFWAGTRMNMGNTTGTFGNCVVPEAKLKDFPLINPSVMAGLGKHYIINVVPLKQTFMEIAKKYPQKTYVYFAYLNNDSWVGINEKDHFTAASTIKVPLAMTVMKAVEEGKLKLDDLYTLTDDDLDENFGSLYKQGAGTSMSVQNLIEVMLADSDNTAMQALIHTLAGIGISDPFGQVYTFMGWDQLPDLGTTPTYVEINLKTLSNMLLALYNAQYTSPEHSQQLLHYLDNSNFNEQIVAGVPSSIAVAHKSGIQDEKRTYTDCGIVYAPQRNYLLCAGSEGANKVAADKFMSEISKAAYDYVINN